MSKTSEQIKDLILNFGKKAPEMTHALKFIGDGNMQKGIGKIADYYFEEGMKKGTIKGAAGGAATLAIGALVIRFVKKKISESKKHEQEGQEILKGLRNGMAEYEAMKNEALISREETDTDRIEEDTNEQRIEGN